MDTQNLNPGSQRSNSFWVFEQQIEAAASLLRFVLFYQFEWVLLPPSVDQSWRWKEDIFSNDGHLIIFLQRECQETQMKQKRRKWWEVEIKHKTLFFSPHFIPVHFTNIHKSCGGKGSEYIYPQSIKTVDARDHKKMGRGWWGAIVSSSIIYVDNCSFVQCTQEVRWGRWCVYVIVSTLVHVRWGCSEHCCNMVNFGKTSRTLLAFIASLSFGFRKVLMHF